jgi:hypothetical protein
MPEGMPCYAACVLSLVVITCPGRMSPFWVAGERVPGFCGGFEFGRGALFRPVGALGGSFSFPTVRAVGFILSPLRGYERPGALADGFVMLDDFSIVLEC